MGNPTGNSSALWEQMKGWDNLYLKTSLAHSEPIQVYILSIGHVIWPWNWNQDSLDLQLNQNMPILCLLVQLMYQQVIIMAGWPTWEGKNVCNIPQGRGGPGATPRRGLGGSTPRSWVRGTAPVGVQGATPLGKILRFSPYVIMIGNFSNRLWLTEAVPHAFYCFEPTTMIIVSRRLAWAIFLICY